MSEPRQPLSPAAIRIMATGYWAGLLVFALALRLWGITQESAWWDEYSSLMHLHRGSLGEFLRYNRTLDPATLPLYYSIEYLWAKLAGTNTLVMRLPSLALGLCIIPATYAIGARCFSKRAGIIAAICVTLSPIHIFHAQGIRMYVLLTLLAALSMYTYLRVRDGAGWRDWLAHGVVQLLLSWTHPFALLVPVVQGLSWLILLPTNGRRFTGWILITLLACAPSLCYLLQIQYWSEESTAGWFAAPTFLGALADVFADDVLSATYQLRVSPGAWGWLPGLGQALFRARPLLDALLAATFVGCATAVLTHDVRQGRARSRDAVLLCIWLVIPVALLFLASLLFRPMLFPRYTVHCSLALYLLAGAAIDRLGTTTAAVSASVILAGLLCFQTGLAHPGPQRSNYLGVASTIEKEARADSDIVVVQGDLYRNVLAYNAHDAHLPMLSAETAALCAWAAHRYLAAMPRETSVWLVSPDDYFDAEPDKLLEDALQQAQLQYERKRFVSIQDIYLYKIGRPESMTAGSDVPPLAGGEDDSKEQRSALRIAAGIAAVLAPHGRGDAARKILEANLREDKTAVYLYGVLLSTLETDPGNALAAYHSAIATSETLGLAAQGFERLAANDLIAEANDTYAPAVVTSSLPGYAVEFPDRVQDILWPLNRQRIRRTSCIYIYWRRRFRRARRPSPSA